MRILYLITGLRLGGAEKQVLLLSKNMRKAGFDVLVVAMESGGVVSKQVLDENIDVVELDITGFKDFYKGYKKLKAVIKEFKPDVVHSHMIHANLFARIFRVFNKLPKLISTAHNIIEGSNLLMNGYRLTNSLANWSTNVSNEAYNLFVDNGYFNGKTSSYIPNAIDTEAFYPMQLDQMLLKSQLGISNDAFVYFAAGRLHKQKNYELLLNAFATVQKNVSTAVLVIAGEGPLEEELKNKSRELIINDKVLFLGKRDDINVIMNLCDCFVLSSDFEGFGLVIAEAMATMKPVVATDSGGVKEVINGNGILVGVNNVDQLAKGMLSVHANPVNMTRLKAAREHIENNYSVSSVINQWIILYSK